MSSSMLGKDKLSIGKIDVSSNTTATTTNQKIYEHNSIGTDHTNYPVGTILFVKDSGYDLYIRVSVSNSSNGTDFKKITKED